MLFSVLLKLFLSSKTLIVDAWILLLLKSVSHISADVTLLKSIELNQEKKNGSNRSLSVCLRAEYPFSSESITVVFVSQFD